MDSKLTYSAEHYRERLSEYAKDTIPYESYNRFLKIKINKHGNPAVVEDLGDYFKIYVSEKPVVRLWVRTPSDFSNAWMGNFHARVFVTHDDVLIKLKASKFQYFSAAFVASIFIIGPLCFTGKLEPASVIFAFLAIAVLTIQNSTGQRKYRNFVSNFLNRIAE